MPLTAWEAAIAARDVSVVCLGDSITEGFSAGPEARYSAMWVSNFGLRAAAKLDLDRPGLFLPACTGASTGVIYNWPEGTNPWTKTGLIAATPSGRGLAGRCVTHQLHGDSISCTVPSWATRATVHVSSNDGTATCQVRVNGSLEASQVMGPGDEADYLVPVDVAGGDLLTITMSGGLGLMYTSGVLFQDTTTSPDKIDVVDSGHAGIAANDFAGGNILFADQWWAPALAKYQPDLVIIELGVNDAQAAASAAAFEDDLETVVSMIDAATIGDPSILFLAMPYMDATYAGGDFYTEALWNDYVTAMENVAATLGSSRAAVLKLVDHGFPNQSGPSAYTADGVHPTAFGSDVIAAALEAFLIPEVPPDIQQVTFTSSTSWIVPDGVIEISGQAWGDGGGSSGHAIGGTGRGGGGGAFSGDTSIAVTPGETLTIEVGQGGSAGASGNNGHGGDGAGTRIRRGGTVLLEAKGGGGGVAPGGGGAAGTGGQASAGTGDTKYNGGNGAVQGGGGSAGAGGPGGNASGATGGAAGAGTNGTAGTSGVSASGGGTGNPVGGGAAGSTNTLASQAGAQGGRGELRISYVVEGVPIDGEISGAVGGMEAAAIVDVNEPVETETFTTSTTWVVPDDVYAVVIQAWGDGGGSSGHTIGGTGRGGGGGAFSSDLVAVTPAESLTIEVGQGGAAGPSGNTGNGGDGAGSRVLRDLLVLVEAEGGYGGQAPGSGGAPGPGGQASNGTGAIRFTGGAGAIQGGGGSAGSEGNGGPASGGTGGAAGAGEGGTAGSNATATSGGGTGNPVGGGAAGSTNALVAQAGAQGGRGEVQISYNTLAPSVVIDGTMGGMFGEVAASTAAVVDAVIDGTTGAMTAAVDVLAAVDVDVVIDASIPGMHAAVGVAVEVSPPPVLVGPAARPRSTSFVDRFPLPPYDPTRDAPAETQYRPGGVR